jgi:N-methylhydantoinase B/oxoprolinase/acetone carboxylase alpha subunit
MVAYQDLMDNSGRLMRNAIRALPDGDHAAETTIDGFLDDEEAKRRDLKIKATLKVRGDEMTVDPQALRRRSTIGRSICHSKAQSTARSG